MALDGVTFLRHLKDLINTCKVCETVQLLQNVFSAMAESWKKLKSSNVFSSFIVCSNQNRYALVHEWLSNNSQCVGRLYEDRSLALWLRDLIFSITAYLQTENYYSTIHCYS